MRLVARTGVEPVIPALRGRCPKPLDERACLNCLLVVGCWWLDVGFPTSYFQSPISQTSLPRQGSNLNFPDPESGVLPITPRGKIIRETKTIYFNLIQSSRKAECCQWHCHAFGITLRGKWCKIKDETPLFKIYYFE